MRWQPGMPIIVEEYGTTLVVCKKTNRYVDTKDKKLRQDYLNIKYNGVEPRYFIKPKSTWHISAILRVMADPIPNPLKFKEIYEHHYSVLEKNSIQNKLHSYRELGLIY